MTGLDQILLSRQPLTANRCLPGSECGTARHAKTSDLSLKRRFLRAGPIKAKLPAGAEFDIGARLISKTGGFSEIATAFTPGISDKPVRISETAALLEI
ncbi:MAG: hypothetical protein F4145_09150 [Boseongicola sp. SB0675_bin_26]|nr:hypothetical protein [Boseongicola sp. SB0675_bin_26]